MPLLVIRAIAVAALALAPTALAGQATGPRTVAIGQTVSGTLRRGDAVLTADSTYAQQWTLDGLAGQIVTIDVASDAFDAYVFVSGPGIGRDLPQDDDSGGHCNARLTVRLPGTGAYHIAVTSREKFATGPFTLSVTLGPRPVSLARCDR